jgi:hypothetical protein
MRIITIYYSLYVVTVTVCFLRHPVYYLNIWWGHFYITHHHKVRKSEIEEEGCDVNSGKSFVLINRNAVSMKARKKYCKSVLSFPKYTRKFLITICMEVVEYQSITDCR